MRGRWSAFCASLPYFMMAGPIQFTFMYCEPRGSPCAHISSPSTACRHGVASRPPYSRGQCCVSQPRSASFAQNAREKSSWASLPGPSFESFAQSAGSSCARNARSSARKAASSGEKAKSTAFPLLDRRPAGERLEEDARASLAQVVA